MIVEAICTDPQHPVNAWLERWRDRWHAHHQINILRHSASVAGGDILFLVSCHEIIRKPVRDKFRHSLVLHASDLPAGSGMSPHIWQILEGRSRITVSLINAEDELDSGDIWQQQAVSFEGHELFDEINAAIFDAEISLMDWAIQHIDSSTPRRQAGERTVYARRKPGDSQIDPERTLASQFDQLRVADPDRYPAFFDFRGQRYKLAITKKD